MADFEMTGNGGKDGEEKKKERKKLEKTEKEEEYGVEGEKDGGGGGKKERAGREKKGGRGKKERGGGVKKKGAGREKKGGRGKEDDALQFPVEKIIDDGIDKNGVKLYKVRWVGYGPKDDTWEPEQNLTNCSDAIADYEAKKLEKRKRKKNVSRKNRSPKPDAPATTREEDKPVPDPERRKHTEEEIRLLENATNSNKSLAPRQQPEENQSISSPVASTSTPPTEHKKSYNASMELKKYYESSMKTPKPVQETETPNEPATKKLRRPEEDQAQTEKPVAPPTTSGAATVPLAPPATAEAAPNLSLAPPSSPATSPSERKERIIGAVIFRRRLQRQQLLQRAGAKNGIFIRASTDIALNELMEALPKARAPVVPPKEPHPVQPHSPDWIPSSQINQFEQRLLEEDRRPTNADIINPWELGYISVGLLQAPPAFVAKNLLNDTIAYAIVLFKHPNHPGKRFVTDVRLMTLLDEDPVMYQEFLKKEKEEKQTTTAPKSRQTVWKRPAKQD